MRKYLAVLALTACAANAPAPVAVVGMRSTIPAPMGPPWVAVDDTVTTWVGWGAVVQVLANDTGLVNVVSAGAYHRQWVVVRPALGAGVDTVEYVAVDTTGVHADTGQLVVTVAGTPMAVDLSVSAVSVSASGKLTVILTTTVSGGDAAEVRFRSGVLPPGWVFRSRQDDRCVGDMPIGRVTCQRPRMSAGTTRVDTLRFTGHGPINLLFRVTNPGGDYYAANDTAAVVAVVP